VLKTVTIFDVFGIEADEPAVVRIEVALRAEARETTPSGARHLGVEHQAGPVVLPQRV